MRGDFEGIAVVGDRFFLVTSTGMLYEFREGAVGSSVPYLETDIGVGDHCEVEGLTHDSSDESLLVACKEVAPDEGYVVVHRLPLDPARGALAPLRIPQDRIRDAGGSRNFSPSAVAIEPETGHIVLLAARQEQILEVTAEGGVVSLFRLSKERHPRPEGLEFAPGGTLLMSDEKDEVDARVTVYQRRVGPGSP
ncbi:MAG: SdiA-regulated domain-containing protein [Gemmatimonadota bacterium]